MRAICFHDSLLKVSLVSRIRTTMECMCFSFFLLFLFHMKHLLFFPFFSYTLTFSLSLLLSCSPSLPSSLPYLDLSSVNLSSPTDTKTTKYDVGASCCGQTGRQAYLTENMCKYSWCSWISRGRGPCVALDNVEACGSVWSSGMEFVLLYTLPRNCFPFFFFVGE